MVPLFSTPKTQLVQVRSMSLNNKKLTFSLRENFPEVDMDVSYVDHVIIQTQEMVNFPLVVLP